MAVTHGNYTYQLERLKMSNEPAQACTPRIVMSDPDETIEVAEPSLAAVSDNPVPAQYLCAYEAAGGYVELRQDWSCLPLLMGSNNEPVYLYEFVDALDEIIDYGDLKEALPNLSYAHFAGGLTFLRKLAQFNTRGIDLDTLEDDAAGSEAELIEQLRTSLADRETTHVLDLHESNGS